MMRKHMTSATGNMPLKRSQNKGASRYGGGIISVNGKGSGDSKNKGWELIIHVDDIYAYTNLDYTESL